MHGFCGDGNGVRERLIDLSRGLIWCACEFLSEFVGATVLVFILPRQQGRQVLLMILC